MADLEALKLKRDQLNARIQQAEARQRATLKKTDDRVKVLVGAAVLNQQTHTPGKLPTLLSLLDNFLERPSERLVVLGEDGTGSEAFKRLTAERQPVTEPPKGHDE